ncbi:MAG: metal ABC transporter permease [Planctomycetia bacterium]|nr:metal ABC transporter permease [Planctomycetia bacterium]
MMTGMLEMLSYPFMARAVIVGILVSLCAARLGISLILKRYSMIGDGLSHVGFGALAMAQVLGFAPLAFTVPVVVLVAILLLRLSETGKIKGDAAIAAISTGSLALGVMVISLSNGANTDLVNYMFGSILAMSDADVTLSLALSVCVLILFIFFYNKIFAVTFDETFAKATGKKTAVYNTIIAALTAITVVLGMRMMGALLISALVIFPGLTAMRLFRSFSGVTVCAVILSAVCFFIGMTLSYLFALPTGASVVLVNILAFVLFTVLGAIRNKYSR